MSSVTALAHANIALIKYWGKTDPELNLPAVGSISLTLDRLYSRTTIESSPGDQDLFMLDQATAAPEDQHRVFKFLSLFREKSNRYESIRVVSKNNFPTAAGLASSASGFAALAWAAAAYFDIQLTIRQLSTIARQGSGSAARSLYGGFVEMKAGDQNKPGDSYALQLFPEDYWDIRLLVLVLTKERKKTGSTRGMQHSAATSPFYQAWVEESESDLKSMREALRRKDFQQIGELAEHSCLKMHAVAASSGPGLLYWRPETLALIQAVRSMRSRGVQAYFTIDAGPQVKVLCLPEDVQKISASFSEYPAVEKIITCQPGPGPQIVEDA